MKILSALSIFACVLATTPSLALPVPSHDAIQGVLATSAFQQAERSALATLRWYDGFNVVVVGRSDSEMMAACHPTGAMSKSGTNLKMTFSNSYSAKSVVSYFATSEQVSDFDLCKN